MVFKPKKAPKGVHSCYFASAFCCDLLMYLFYLFVYLTVFYAVLNNIPLIHRPPALWLEETGQWPGENQDHATS